MSKKINAEEYNFNTDYQSESLTDACEEFNKLI